VVGQGAVKELRAIKSCKKQKIVTDYALFLLSNNVDLKNANRNYGKPS